MIISSWANFQDSISIKGIPVEFRAGTRRIKAFITLEEVLFTVSSYYPIENGKQHKGREQ